MSQECTSLSEKMAPKGVVESPLTQMRFRSSCAACLRMTNHPSLPGTVLVSALKFPGKQGHLVTLLTKHILPLSPGLPTVQWRQCCLPHSRAWGSSHTVVSGANSMGCHQDAMETGYQRS